MKLIKTNRVGGSSFQSDPVVEEKPKRRQVQRSRLRCDTLGGCDTVGGCDTACDFLRCDTAGAGVGGHDTVGAGSCDTVGAAGSREA